MPANTLLNNKGLWSQRAYVEAVITGAFILGISLVINYAAVQFAIYKSGAATTDIILSNLPVINTDIIFSQGALLFVVFVSVILFLKPRTIPYTLKGVGLFIIIRATFVIMTHYGPYTDHINAQLDAIHYLSSGADLFFSGHTGLPFLLALFFWDTKRLRVIFIACSVVAAVAVLLGHLHYTIDVFSAYFIAYGINRIAERLFVYDRIVFLGNQ